VGNGLMNHELETKAIATKMFITILAVLGIYHAAFCIAVIASFSRMAYKSEPSNDLYHWFQQWFRLFIINVSMTMFIVHVGAWAKYNPDLIVMISAVCAFLSREIIDLVLYLITMMRTKWLAQVIENKIGGENRD